MHSQAAEICRNCNCQDSCKKSERMHFLSASSCKVWMFRILYSKSASRRFISAMPCDVFDCRRASRKSAPECSTIAQHCRRFPFPILSGILPPEHFRAVHHWQQLYCRNGWLVLENLPLRSAADCSRFCFAALPVRWTVPKPHFRNRQF